MKKTHRCCCPICTLKIVLISTVHLSANCRCHSIFKFRRYRDESFHQNQHQFPPFDRSLFHHVHHRKVRCDRLLRQQQPILSFVSSRDKSTKIRSFFVLVSSKSTSFNTKYFHIGNQHNANAIAFRFFSQSTDTTSSNFNIRIFFCIKSDSCSSSSSASRNSNSSTCSNSTLNSGSARRQTTFI